MCKNQRKAGQQFFSILLRNVMPYIHLSKWLCNPVLLVESQFIIVNRKNKIYRKIKNCRYSLTKMQTAV